MRRTSLWKSFGCAFEGLGYVLRTQRNARIQMVVALAVILLGAYLRLPIRDWAIIVLTMGAVMAAEIGNTVVETVVDLVSSEYQESAKVAKDAAAGAVLLLAITAFVVGLLVLGPPLYGRLFS